ncbi:MAG: TIM barrel protein [Clostridia bacterium]|nr:TIM barrel protein [Clostridia bacterium]
MRASVVLPCFFPQASFEGAVEQIARIGYDACEIWGWKDIDIQRFKDALLKNAVELLSICTTDFRMNDPAYSQAWLSGLRESVLAAGALGAKKLITQVGQDTGKDRAYQRDAIYENLKKAAPILEDNGITLMIEPLNTLFDHKGYFLWSSKEAFDIVNKVDSPFVKVVFDIYHQQVTEGNILNNILDNLDYVAHLHAAGHPGRTDLQLGENDYRVIFDRIDKAGYEGACGLEYFPSTDALDSLKRAKEIYF